MTFEEHHAAIAKAQTAFNDATLAAGADGYTTSIEVDRTSMMVGGAQWAFLRSVEISQRVADQGKATIQPPRG